MDFQMFSSSRKMVYGCLLSLLFLCILSDLAEAGGLGTVIPDGHQLHHALHYFEVLHKDHVRHSLIKRTSRQLHFNTLGKDFRLVLTTRQDPLRRDLKVHVIGEGGSHESFGVNTDHFLTGRLADDPHSSVHAHFDHSKGLLSASIRTHADHYYIEPSHRHFQQSHDFHMISYRASDLKYNLTDDPSQHFCGVSDAHHPVSTLSHHRHSKTSKHSPRISLTKSGQRNVHVQSGRDRLKRQTSSTDKVLCPLDLVATYKFHRTFSTGNNTQDGILFLVTVIDMADDQIFRETQWSDDIGRLGFAVNNITIFTTPSTSPTYNSHRPRGWASTDLLNEFTQHDWSDVCLAHLFTAEDFTDGNLGLAFIASSDRRAIGGICSPMLENYDGYPISTQNVGVSSFQRDSRPLLIAEAKLVVAHELGHNWGSNHDPTGIDTTQCNPSLNDGGKFIMFPSATDGNQENNDEFSVCSRRMISDVLREKNSLCFIENIPMRCGNYAVDESEECDAGFIGTLGNDPCCDSSCRLRPQANCSDVNEDCCSGCGYADNSTLCQEYPLDTVTCLENVTCSGTDGKCPSERTFLGVGTGCQGTGICLPKSTQCNDSLPCEPDPMASPSDPLKCFNLCEQQNMTQCFCEALSVNECRLCCRNNSENSTCFPLGDSILLSDGSTCLGGLCEDGLCVLITQDLANRLFQLFNNVDIDTFFVFMSENIVGTVLFLTTLLWVPITIIVSIVDDKAWEKFSKEADDKEKEVLLNNLEDKQDLNEIDTLAQTNPDIDTTQAKKALKRQVSITDSVYDGLYVFGSNYFLPSSPDYSKTGERKLSVIAEESAPDPELHNIHAHVGHRRDSEVKVQSTESRGQDLIDVGDAGQQSATFSEWSIITSV